MIFLKVCVDLSFENLRRLHLKAGQPALLPVIARFPQPPMPVVEFLDDPWQPSESALSHHQFDLGMPLEDAPRKEIDEGIEKLADEGFGGHEHTGRLADRALGKAFGE